MSCIECIKCVNSKAQLWADTGGQLCVPRNITRLMVEFERCGYVALSRLIDERALKIWRGEIARREVDKAVLLITACSQLRNWVCSHACHCSHGWQVDAHNSP